MYVEGETLRLMAKSGKPDFNSTETAQLANYKKHLDTSTKFIPSWVKVAVALALGLGTMVGWKRIVVTVGEKIGKDHLTYAQGASAEIVAAITIIATGLLCVLALPFVAARKSANREAPVTAWERQNRQSGDWRSQGACRGPRALLASTAHAGNH